MNLQDRSLLTFRPGARRLETRKVSVHPLTHELRVRVRRPTSTTPFKWDCNSTLRVSFIYRLDGIEHRCSGQVSGGVRLWDERRSRRELDYYELVWHPSSGIVQTPGESLLARSGQRWRDLERDGCKQYLRVHRLGEGARRERLAYLVFEQVGGDNFETEVLVAHSLSKRGGLVQHHNSVAFDQVSDAIEEAGDKILSVSHTPVGSSDLAAFAGSGGYGSGAGLPSTSFTYDGAAMTEQWDQTTSANSNLHHAGYTLAGIPTGAKTVENTLGAGTASIHFIQVQTMTGVHQTVPVGTHAKAGPVVSPWSVTVSDAGADDLVVDNLASYGGNGIDEPVIGADQTLRAIRESAAGTTFLRGSSQPGSAGGVMSWTLIGSIDGFLGAIAFKPASAGGAVMPARRPGFTMGRRAQKRRRIS